MKVVFFDDVEGTAQVGDVKDVKNGFARNFLLPRGLAGPTTRTISSTHRRLPRRKRAARNGSTPTPASTPIASWATRLRSKRGLARTVACSVPSRTVTSRKSSNATSGLEVDPHLILLPNPFANWAAGQ